MSSDKKNKADLEEGQKFYHNCHARPRTRREFLGQGFLGSSAVLAAPTMSTLLSSSAFGIECGAAGGGSNMPPGFICLDLAGGANIAGSNVIVGGEEGQKAYLPQANAYRSLGLPDDMHPGVEGQVNEELGLAFHADSAFLRGILATTTAATRANVDGMVFCSASIDDVGNNALNPTYWIAEAGAKGSLASNLGSNNSDSGGNSISPGDSVNPANRPIQIASENDARNLVKAGKLAELFAQDQTGKAAQILKAIESMSASQLQKFQNKDLPAQVSELVQCGYIKSTEMITQFTPDAVDPTLDPAFSAIFNDLQSADERRLATMSYLVLKGYAGAATFTKGGFDYHNGSRATGEQRDEEAGRLMGMALEAAAKEGRQLVLYVYSDGGVFSNGTADNNANGKLVWTGDSGVRAAPFMLAYDPSGRPKVRDGAGRQIGHYKENGSIETNANKISDNPTNLSKAVVANYLALQGREGELADVVGDDPFGSDLGQYLVFEKKAG